MNRAPFVYTLAIAVALATLTASGIAEAGTALRFRGNGVNDIDRVKIPIDDPATSAPGPPADVGATDLTIEFWMKGFAAENQAAAVSCGDDINWIFGNIVIDRDRYNQDRKFGLSIAGGTFVFGVSGDGTDPVSNAVTICGATPVLDGRWRHVAIQRRRTDGWMWIFVDGVLDAQGNGPDGDITYPDDGVPGDFCGGPCVNSDPFIVLAAEKHDAGTAYPSFSGWLDEIRISNTLRYAAGFAPSRSAFTPDASTLALYHLNEGSGDFVGDSSGAPGGPSHGERRFGGTPAGPEWSAEGFDASITGVEPAERAGPHSPPRLLASPNPVRARTTLVYEGGRGPDGDPPLLRIHDISGRLVATIPGRGTAHGWEFTWEPETRNGRALAHGVYIASLRVGTTHFQSKLLRW